MEEANLYLCLWQGQSQSDGLGHWDFAQKIPVVGGGCSQMVSKVMDFLRPKGATGYHTKAGLACLTPCPLELLN